MKNRSKLFFILLLFSAGYALAQGDQSQAAATTKQTSVEQGGQVKVTVKLNPAPSMPGQVAIVLASKEDSSSPQALANSGVSANQNETDMTVQIPYNGTPGTWGIRSIDFRPIPSNGTEVYNLNIAGKPLTFEVVNAKAVVPKSADVQIR